MAGVETYGGRCPNCTKPMFQKYDSNTSALLFDACAHCGFIYGSLYDEDKGITEIDKESASHIWNHIFKRHNVTTIEALINHFDGYKIDKDNDEFHPSIFDYSGDSVAEIQSHVFDLKNFKSTIKA